MFYDNFGATAPSETNIMARKIHGSTRDEYQLEHDARFLKRVEHARNSLRAGRGVRLEDIEPEWGTGRCQ